MPDFKYHQNVATGEQWLETSLSGRLLLNHNLLNKGTAFSLEERKLFGLHGKLPVQVETLAQQVSRAYSQYKRYQTDLSRNIYLNNLRDRNETVFYRLLSEHLAEMMPMIYTPIVGTAVKAYSKEFRTPRGIYLTQADQPNLPNLLRQGNHANVDLIVVTDGRGVLGIGDQGVGAMDIPIAKLMVYTLFAGIHPSRTLPVMLDMGTDNQLLRQDPLYLGCRHPRITGKEYDDFIAAFVAAVTDSFPKAFLHWEDLGQSEASQIMLRYQDRCCTFNDDIQGTGVVTVAGLMAACQGLQLPLSQQRVVVFGAGTAGIGITQQWVTALVRQGLSEQEARQKVWLIDKPGLLTTQVSGVTSAQQPFLRPVAECAHWQAEASGGYGLLEVVQQVRPTVLIGCSAVSGAFNQAVVQAMAQHAPRPIIFPLSNPTERAEAHPADLLAWTDGNAVVATGSPFMGVAFRDVHRDIAQSNNALAFPGIGLGILAARATRCTEGMLAAASEAIQTEAPILADPYGNCLPALSQAPEVTHAIAIRVAEQAQAEGVAEVDDSLPMALRVANNRWQPDDYLPLHKSNA